MTRLVCLFVSVVVLAGSARADDTFVAKTQVYVDSDHTTVVSPLVALSRDAWRGGTLQASYVADIVSSASIDVVSNATKSMADFRSEVNVGLQQKIAASTLAGHYIYSVEHDYSSHNFDIGLQQDFFKRNSTLAIGYNYAHNDVGRANDQLFHRTLDVHGLGISWTQTLSAKTLGQLSYTLGINEGYQASPYRFVRIVGGAADVKVPETEPNERLRHAIVAGIQRHLFKDSALHADYRFYIDSWGVSAHTIQLAYFIQFGDVTLRLRERFYYQAKANFFQTQYVNTDDQTYVSSDRELSTFWSNLVGVKVSWRLPWLQRAVALEVKADVFYYGYIDYALLPWRVGANLSAGVSVLY